MGQPAFSSDIYALGIGIKLLQDERQPNYRKIPKWEKSFGGIMHKSVMR